jgi:DNA-binding LacI/PurR family transcriptional regulator
VKHHALAQSKMHEAKQLMGLAVGQKSTSPGTLYNDTVIITSFLKTVFMGVEESMSQFGYNVVIGSASTGRKRKG